MRVKIYSKISCPYCVLAKNWFNDNGVEFQEILLDKPTQEQKLEFFNDAPGARTVPQILVLGNLIGGYDNLIENESYVRSLLGL